MDIKNISGIEYDKLIFKLLDFVQEIHLFSQDFDNSFHCGMDYTGTTGNLNCQDSPLYNTDNQKNSENDTLKLPFYKSYQEANGVCFTRVYEYGSGNIRDYDFIHLLLNKMKETFGEDLFVSIYVHHPGQLTRV